MAEAQIAAGKSVEMDYPEHEKTYRRFITFSKWSVIHIVVILALMAIFLL
ncbi:aa3-type cytochrome c oxidase subunit IV [Chelatococcus reniformis]|uniref:Cytochrome c oxidase subunit IV bacterial aa3 type domain-containing protein n=1 Tax=Chelatococcus reniformis TaxID=1494448 RepID=A0A916UFP2_9HYPH|nr:aa3-type cytochrome c oxidase subunit IV [Chelatococcus reniformis]GGC70705.1 hypothetical protein GCM10010994_31560 [Chelatococcus reniformis]